MGEDQIIRYDIDPHVVIAILCICVAMFVLIFWVSILSTKK